MDKMDKKEHLNIFILIVRNMDNSVSFRFLGPNFKSKKIPHSKLSAISKSIHALAKRIKYLDGDKNCQFDYNIHLFEGSIGIECSPIDNSIKDFNTLQKLAGTICSFDEESKNAIETYSEDYTLRKNLKYFVNQTKVWADALEISTCKESSKSILSNILLNDALIERIATKKEQSGTYSHFALVHFIKSRPTKIGITTYNKKLDMDFNTIDSEKFRKYWNRFVLVKYSVYPDKTRKVLTIQEITDNYNPSDSKTLAYIDKIDSFHKYKTNWDSHGSKAITSQMISVAKQKIILLNNLFKEQKIQIPLAIVPVPNGNIQIEYQQGNNYFEIELMPTGKSTVYLIFDNKEYMYDNIEFELAIDLVMQFFTK